MRDNARLCAEGYLTMRERLGYPLCKTTWTVGEQPPLLEGKPASRVLEDGQPSQKDETEGGRPVAELLFELGSEELPARFVVPALDDLERVFVEQCKALEHHARGDPPLRHAAAAGAAA